MRRLVSTLFTFVFCGTLFLAAAPRTFAAVVINEILPKSADVKQTWIELYNSGSESVSLDRWRLENANGTSFILNASAIISPRGFLTFFQTQSGITLNTEGDTVRLFDETNALKDAQSYPGILGYNTSMGRSTDGAEGWVTCSPAPDYSATPNKSNDCPPPPTPTATTSPLPATSSPTSSPRPTATPTTSTIDSRNAFSSPQVLGEVTPPSPSPTPTPQPFLESDLYGKIWAASLVFGVSAGVTIMLYGLYTTRKRT